MEAVLFDLDGTLLQMDTRDFMSNYLQAVSGAVASVAEPRGFARALMESTGSMLANRDPGVTNAQAFWADFRARLGDNLDRLEPLIDDFYANQFKNLSWLAQPCKGGRQAVQAALDRGLRIVLATNPVFPRSAVRDRMIWAGVDDLPWEFVTSYEEMHFCKPHIEYYLEITSLLGLQPEKCLMVGNDMQEDMVAAKTGMMTYLVTDFLIDTGEEEFRADWVGSLNDLADWLKSSPVL